MYTEDAVLARPSDPDNPVVGRAAIFESFKARPPRTTAHLLGNSIFKVLGQDRVDSLTRVWLVSGPAGNKLPITADSKLLIGTFRDSLIKVQGNWLIAHRDGSIELKYGESW